MKNLTYTFLTFLIFLTFSKIGFAGTIFNPNAPLYIEYHSKEKLNVTDISVQIEDAKSPAKIRLALQSKPESESTFYGYLWLQIGSKITNEVLFRRVRQPELKAWLSEQDGLQALFLFDTDEDLNQFKIKAENSKKPLADKNNLPALMNKPTPVTGPTLAQKTLTNKPLDVGSSDLDEASKYGRLISAYNELSPEQKKLNDKKSDEVAGLAIKQYQLKNYTAAENQFSESLRLNPTSSMNKYYLALCYYQNKKYQRSLALLSLAEGADYNYAEYKYYSGLNQLKLKNYTKAIEDFSDAKDENDPDYSGPSAFYSGHIYFQKEDFPNARKNFEYTIDQSKNPKMDRESEAMIEKMDVIDGYKNQMKERFKYSLFAGFGYDSNVLNISTENLSTNLSAYRFMYGTSLGYKFFYTYDHDLSVDFNFNDYYSLDSKFKSDATVQSADPQQLSLGLPYHLRFQVGQRIFTWGLLPSYQTLNMSLDGGSRKKILDSTVFGSDLNFAVSDRFFSKIFFEYSIDKSSIESATGDNDLSAKKVTLNTTQTFVADPTQKKNWLLDLGYVSNAAEGKNNDYNKILAAVTYSQLGFWSAINSLKIDYANTKYASTDTNRADSVATANLGLSKDLTKKLSLGLNAQYTLSASNIETFKYNKFLVQSILSYSGAF